MGHLIAQATVARALGSNSGQETQMYGGTGVIRRLAQQVSEQGTEIRRDADQHDDAAQALRHHADEVDRLKDLIRRIAQRVQGLIEGARSRLADLADKALDLVKRVTPDPIDEVLASFQPPPDGHKDWVDVPDRLPGGV